MEGIATRSAPLLTHERKTIYNLIIMAVLAAQGVYFLLDAPVETDKTLLIPQNRS